MESQSTKMTEYTDNTINYTEPSDPIDFVQSAVHNLREVKPIAVMRGKYQIKRSII